MRCRSAAAVGEKALNPWKEAADAFPPGCGHSVARLRARQLEVRLAGYGGGMRIVITADAVLLMDSRSAQVGVLPPPPPPLLTSPTSSTCAGSPEACTDSCQRAHQPVGRPIWQHRAEMLAPDVRPHRSAVTQRRDSRQGIAV